MKKHKILKMLNKMIECVEDSREPARITDTLEHARVIIASVDNVTGAKSILCDSSLTEWMFNAQMAGGVAELVIDQTPGRVLQICVAVGIEAERQAREF